MSHNIEILDGVAQMAYAGETPWHGLGTKVEADLSPREIMLAAGLDWEVGKFDNCAYVPGGVDPVTLKKAGPVRVKTGEQSLIRLSDNKVLSPSVGQGWEPVQNSEAFDFFAEFVSNGDMEMHTAGSLQDGKYVWALAKVNESFEILGGDKVDSYLLFSNSHVFGKSMVIDFTPIRVVCNNTLTMALGKKSSNRVTVSHRTKFDANRVKELMGIAHNKLADYKAAAEALAAIKVSEDDLMEYFSKVFPLTSAKNLRGKELSRNAEQALVMNVSSDQPGIEFAPGTWWNAFNTVTFMYDHQLAREDDTRMFNSWLGTGRSKKIDAYNLALDMAGANADLAFAA